MRVAMMRTDDGERVVVDRGDGEFVLTALGDLGEALRTDALAEASTFRDGSAVDVTDADLAPVAGRGAKVICIGHNFTQHILEMGHGLPEYPNVFSKYSEALIGASDTVELDPIATSWDWEAELTLVIGRTARRVDEDAALDHVAGYTVANDISARDWQRRATQWLLGKTFENTTPVGPWMVTADELDPTDGLTLTCTVDGVEKQSASTADLLFKPAFLISYLSHVLTLNPGDLVLTGTPAGVAAGSESAQFLRPGQVVATEVEGIGRLVNACVSPAPARRRAGRNNDV